MPRIHALIPAAGRSVRFGGTTVKQYTHLLGKPVLGHSIDAVRCIKAVLSVTVALADDDGIFEELMRPSYPAVRTAVGGATRAQTVMNGVDQILEQDPDNVRALNALGYTLADRTERYEEALQYISKAYAQEPDDPIPRGGRRIGAIAALVQFWPQARQRIWRQAQCATRHLTGLLAYLTQNRARQIPRK